MKKIRFLNIFLGILALALFFPGCVDDSAEPSVGNLYYGLAGDGNYVYISILTPANRAVKLQSGDPYAVAVFKVINGASNWDGETYRSKGTVAVSSSSGTSLDFNPGESYSGKGSGTLSSDGKALRMNPVPGTNYNLTLNFDRAVTSATASSPFGNTIPLPNEDDPGGTPPTTNPGETPTPTDPKDPQFQPFVAGCYVTNVEVYKLPTAKVIYEGKPVDLTGLTFEVTYSDGTSSGLLEIGKNNVKSEDYFTINPPGYGKPGAEHTLTYIKEYYNGEVKYPNGTDMVKTPTPSIPYLGATVSGMFSAWKKADGSEAYYELKKWELNGTPVIKKYEGWGYEGLNDILKGTYIVGSASQYGPLPTDTNIEKNVTLAVTVKEDGNKFSLIFGAGNGEDPGKITGDNDFQPININGSTDKKREYKLPNTVEVFKLREIYVPTDNNKSPFSAPITFDDPRFFGTDSTAVIKNWYSHLGNAKIGLVYENSTTRDKIINLVEAASRNTALKDKSKILPINLITYPVGGWGERKLEFQYGDTQIKTKLAIPLYDTLKEIGFNNTKSTIVIDGQGSDDTKNKPYDEQSFLRLAQPYAIYQKSTNKNDLVKKLIFDTNYGFNFHWINGGYDKNSFVTNVNRDGILNSANSNAYEKSTKLQKANVTFNAFDGYLRTYDTPSQSKSATVPVGVKNFGD